MKILKIVVLSTLFLPVYIVAGMVKGAWQGVMLWGDVVQREIRRL